MTRLLALGLGYTAAPIAARVLSGGGTVLATTRSGKKAAALREQGYEALVWDAPAPLPEDVLVNATSLLVSLSPDEEGCPAARAICRDAITPKHLIVYLSSSGVYGDHDGAWVDEQTSPAPTEPRGQRRLRAENDWRKVAEERGAGLVICRLAGIYGPGRNAVETMRGQILGEETRGGRSGLGQRIDKPGHVFNRIHRDDIVRAVDILLQRRPEGTTVVNFADDLPCASADVITCAAELLGVAPPPRIPFAEAPLSPMARSFYADNKRLCNRRLKELVGGALLYPTYREGLESVVEIAEHSAAGITDS